MLYLGFYLVCVNAVHLLMIFYLVIRIKLINIEQYVVNFRLRDKRDILNG